MTGRSLFLMTVGTGDYVPVRYSFEGHVTRTDHVLASAAILELLGEPTGSAELVCLVTDKAEEKHKEALEAAFRGTWPLRFVRIHDGKDQGELWGNFQLILDAIPAGSRVTVDLTNGFRSLPASMLMALGFVEELKQVSVERVLYGAFEVLGTAAQVKQWKGEGRAVEPAPVFDLTEMFKLRGWAQGVSEWRRTGQSEGLTRRVEDIVKPRRRELHAVARQLVDLPQRLQASDATLSVLRHDRILPAMAEALATLGGARSQMGMHPELKPFLAALEDLEGELVGLTTRAEGPTGPIRDQLRIGRWLLGRHRIVEALVIVREALTTWGQRVLSDQLGRRVIRSQAGSFEHYVQAEGKDTRSSTPGDLAALKRWCEANGAARKLLARAVGTAERLRNKVMHAWSSEEDAKEGFSPKVRQDLEAELLRVIGEIEQALDAEVPVAPVPVSHQPKVLLNISNHPFDTWPAEQRVAAEELGAVTELALPIGDIPTDAPVESLRQRVREIVEEAERLGATTAFVSTEPVLTHALVNALGKRDIRCVAAVTERRVEETAMPDGSIQVRREFRFRGWREYL